MRRYSLIRVLWAPLLILGLLLSGCQSDTKTSETPKSEPAATAKKELPATIGIGTVPVGGANYVAGTGVAKVLSDRSPIKVIVRPMAGANAFNPLIESGELELGLEGIDTSWAYNGGPGYDKPMKNMRVLVRGHMVPTIPLAVRLNSDINSIKDLKGKRVASGYGGFVVGQMVTEAILESGGLTMKDVKSVPVADPTSAIRALQEGRVDAVFGANVGSPTHVEVDAAVPLRALNFGDLSPEQADKAPQNLIDLLHKYVPSASIVLQKKGGYLDSDATIISYPMMLTASAKLSDDAAYEVVKTLYENDKELHPIHAFLKDWNQATMFVPDPMAPYDEGAVRFWKEKGLWTPEAEANQKRLLGQ